MWKIYRPWIGRTPGCETGPGYAPSREQPAYAVYTRKPVEVWRLGFRSRSLARADAHGRPRQADVQVLCGAPALRPAPISPSSAGEGRDTLRLPPQQRRGKVSPVFLSALRFGCVDARVESAPTGGRSPSPLRCLPPLTLLLAARQGHARHKLSDRLSLQGVSPIHVKDVINLAVALP